MFGTSRRRCGRRGWRADERNRIRDGDAALLVRTASGMMIIDAGMRRQDGREERRHLRRSIARDNLDVTLAGAGCPPATSTSSLASHLHFDHAGGFTARDGGGRVVPRLPRARYSSAAASGRTRRIRTSGTARATSPENYVPLVDAGVRRFRRERRGSRARRPRPADRRPHDAPPDRAASSRAEGPRSSRPISFRRRRTSTCRGSWATTSIPWTRWRSSGRSSRKPSSGSI